MFAEDKHVIDPFVSIRSPHKSKGRHWVNWWFRLMRQVSIRSPHKSKGRLLWGARRQCSYTFQSAPLTKARGDLPTPTDPPSLPEFQSAPLTKARGDLSRQRWDAPLVRFNPLPSQKQGETTDSKLPPHASIVSIRSPHKSKGRPEGLGPCRQRLLFQSAPLTKARGDPADTPSRGYSICFNPLPSQKQGETRPIYLDLHGLRGFNPLPSQKQGETDRHGHIKLAGDVSIRSPHKSKGRPARASSCPAPTKFQSAPLTKARGD